MAPPQIWIDATEPSAGRQLWGMTLVERQVREMALRGGVHFRIYVTPQTAERAAAVRPDLHRLYQVEIETVEVAAGCDMFSQLYRADGGLILLAGDAVYDGRVLDYLMDRGSGHAVMEEARGALFLASEEAEQLAVQAGEMERGVGLGDRPSRHLLDGRSRSVRRGTALAYACLYLPSARQREREDLRPFDV